MHNLQLTVTTCRPILLLSPPPLPSLYPLLSQLMLRNTWSPEVHYEICVCTNSLFLSKSTEKKPQVVSRQPSSPGNPSAYRLMLTALGPGRLRFPASFRLSRCRELRRPFLISDYFKKGDPYSMGSFEYSPFGNSMAYSV